MTCINLHIACPLPFSEWYFSLNLKWVSRTIQPTILTLKGDDDDDDDEDDGDDGDDEHHHDDDHDGDEL